ncbi:hypothetical protein BIY37_04880 [Candidatus Brocadia sapporoensis]|uniref:Uncharacterized protein n=1 Tax=Candidatus Brocadia sapporoensis TaxID=392547 RepID=A0A1V6M183_9BACT|nr:hypothetical protein [Candidatus Brocadia sapporoensis]OQD46159.1 hypothetical protein BIY37_04880 [Candidatus Brocadia sapporoensis]GJQ23558.1 MAG: hypothetical protein HBSAPP01_13480 [Candidatus Brocadia sapporoensis]
MLKKFGCGIIAVGVLTFGAGVVNSSFTCSVMAEDKEKGKDEKSGELMPGAIKTAFSVPVKSEDKDEEKDKEGKSGKLI